MLNNYKAYGQKAITLIECLLPAIPKGDGELIRSRTPLGMYVEKIKHDLIKQALSKVSFQLKEGATIAAS